jgi:hypothetical protein
MVEPHSSVWHPKNTKTHMNECAHMNNVDASEDL